MMKQTLGQWNVLIFIFSLTLVLTAGDSFVRSIDCNAVCINGECNDVPTVSNHPNISCFENSTVLSEVRFKCNKQIKKLFRFHSAEDDLVNSYFSTVWQPPEQI